ncbi:MAG TPA: TPM domain-containing protein [Burkholderiales bacterium]|nr:TPM domain-containing protein [Burkholderiales bacterium]
MRRLLRHLFSDRAAARRAFPPSVLRAIEAEIKAQESRHRGELRFAVEASLPIAHLARRLTPRARALEVFGRLRVWDTQDNSGVLLYVLLADRSVEIVADRGIAARVPQAEWDAVCRAMGEAFRAGEFERGALDGLRRVGALLGRHFPPAPSKRDELPDAPVML